MTRGATDETASTRREVATPGTAFDRALGEVTAQGVVCAVLRGALGGAARASGGAAAGTAVARLEERLRRAQLEDEVPVDVDTEVLARFLVTVRDGLAVQVAGGVDPEELHRTVEVALRVWRSVRAGSGPVAGRPVVTAPPPGAITVR